MSEKASRTVFIGNIPYGQSEEQIKEICGTVGQVVSFRPIYDSDTGRPRGYGFVEYADADAAASAVRNLNGYKIDGRDLRVDFSKRNDNDDSGHTGGGSSGAPAPVAAAAPTGAAAANGIGPLPPGVDLPPGVSCSDAISKTLTTLPPPQLLDILSQMKGLVTGDPGKATELLRQAPQLSYAIFQALLLMGLVDSQLIASVVQQAATDVGQQSQPPQQAPPPQQYQSYVPTPPINQPPFQPPPPQQAPPPQQQPNHEELLKQVLAMPQSEVDKLGPAERAQIMQLKAQFGGRI